MHLLVRGQSTPAEAAVERWSALAHELDGCKIFPRSPSLPRADCGRRAFYILVKAYSRVWLATELSQKHLRCRGALVCERNCPYFPTLNVHKGKHAPSLGHAELFILRFKLSRCSLRNCPSILAVDHFQEQPTLVDTKAKLEGTMNSGVYECSFTGRIFGSIASIS